MSENPDEFDLSNMKKYKSNANYNTLGKMKSEVGENIITEFCALNPKTYCYRYLVEDKIKENKKAKGVSMPVVDKTIQFNDYQTVMESNKPEKYLYILSKVLTDKYLRV